MMDGAWMIRRKNRVSYVKRKEREKDGERNKIQNAQYHECKEEKCMLKLK